jgi:hypothetical protein
MERSGVIDTVWCMNRDELKKRIKAMLDGSVFSEMYDIYEYYEINTHVIRFELRGIDDHILIYMPYVIHKNASKYKYMSGRITTTTLDLTFTNETIDEVLEFTINRLIELRSPELERPSTLENAGISMILESVNSKSVEHFLNSCLHDVGVIAKDHGISESYTKNLFRQAL